MNNKIEYPERKTTASLESPETFSGLSGRSYSGPILVTINQAKEITGLSYNALRQMCLKNEIVHLRVGKKFMIHLEKLLAKINNGEA